MSMRKWWIWANGRERLSLTWTTSQSSSGSELLKRERICKRSWRKTISKDKREPLMESPSIPNQETKSQMPKTTSLSQNHPVLTPRRKRWSLLRPQSLKCHNQKPLSTPTSEWTSLMLILLLKCLWSLTTRLINFKKLPKLTQVWTNLMPRWQERSNWINERPDV